MNLKYVIQWIWFLILMLVCTVITITVAPMVWMFSEKADPDSSVWFAWRPVICEPSSGWAYPLWLCQCRRYMREYGWEDAYWTYSRMNKP